MPQQLIYTSAPRGVVAGRSGHCTVARSASMREALMLHLEKLSYYQHLSLSGGKERAIYSCRVVDIRGSRYHVLSRIQDAGLDFTGRTNFVAHHLVFTPEEIRQLPSPPAILSSWSGWVKSWPEEPQLLENENWSDITQLATPAYVPATNWQRVTGDAVNGYGLLEARSGIAFRVDNLSEEQILALFAESLELFELRDPRRDFRASAWQYTFTTSMQEQDNPADFRWRCLHSDNPVSGRFAGPDCRALTHVRVSRVTAEEATFARFGRQPPKLVKLSADKADIQEGTIVRMEVATDGVPVPRIKWFEDGKVMIGLSGTMQELKPSGRAKRFRVEAENSVGKTVSNVIEISIRASVRLQRPVGRQTPSPDVTESVQTVRPKTREEWQDSEETTPNSTKYISGWWLIAVGSLLVICLASWWLKERHTKQGQTQSVATTNAPDGKSVNAPPEMPPSTSSDEQPRSSNEAPNTTTDSNPGPNPRPASSLPPATTFELPPGWASVNIGVIANQSWDFVSNIFRLTVAGNGFSSTNDNVLFVFKSNSTPELTVSLVKLRDKVTLPQNAGRGIMIRESLVTNSPFFFIGASSQKIFAYSRDSAQRFSYRELEMTQSTPLIVRFRHDRNQLIADFTFDYEHWSAFQTNGTFANKRVMAGFAAYSGSLSNGISAQFAVPTQQRR